MSGRKPTKMLTPRQFAERHGVAYSTVMHWLRRGEIPGAVKQTTPTGHYWEIPVTAAKPELKTGRPPKAAKKAGGKRGMM